MRSRLCATSVAWMLAAVAGCGGGSDTSTTSTSSGMDGGSDGGPTPPPVWTLHGPDAWHSGNAGRQPIDLGSYVSTDAAADRFTLVASGAAAPIVVGSDDFPGVVRVASDLGADVQRVTGVNPTVSQDKLPAASQVVVIGTVGKSALITSLVKANKLDVSALDGKWETWTTQIVEAPMAGVDRALVIAGSDQRGTIFGTYDLSRQIGVSPWYFWDDVVPVHRDSLYVLPGVHTLGQPAVKYRGFFINDENPDLGNWAPVYFGPGKAPGYSTGFNKDFYAKIFEVMLRLRANYLWPAVWGRAFDLDDPESHALAKQYGVVMGTSHEAPMDRGIEEWNRKPNGDYSFRTNADKLKAYWQVGIQRMVDGSFEDLVTIGMRGTGDTSLPDGDSVPLITDIMNSERQIIGDVTKKDPTTVPQVWTLYKEVQGYWDRGFRPPSDVTVIYCDDNWGNFRALPDQREDPRGGGYGLYYHFDYVGGGRDYKWVDTALLANAWEQLSLAYTYGVDRVWMANVGDLKTNELPTEFFLDYAWSPETWTVENLPTWETRYATEQFGADHATDIAAVLHAYGKLQSRRKPELLNRVIQSSPSNLAAVAYVDGSTFSLTAYQEAERVTAEWKALRTKAEALAPMLGTSQQDAYFELVLYEIAATSNLYDLRLAEFKNLLYAGQARASAPDMADAATARFTDDKAMSTNFNTTIASGKWKTFQSQTKIGYGGDYADSSWQAPDGSDFMFPAIKKITVPDAAGLGVAIDGSEKAWPAETTAAVLPTFSPYQTQAQQYIEVFNTGNGSFDFTITPDMPWVTVDPAKGTLDGTTKQMRALVSVDWAQVPMGTNNVNLAVAGNGTTVTVGAVVDSPASPPTTPNAFVEANGYVSMEAEHFARKVETSDITWKLIPDIGRTASGLIPLPTTSPRQTPGGDTPRLEYDIHTFSMGAVLVAAYLSPRNNVRRIDGKQSDGLKYAVSIDDEAPVVVNVTAATGSDDAAMNQPWERNTSDNVALTYSHHMIAAPGAHVLKFWMVDPTIVVQKLVVDTGGLQTSYLGPPESVRFQP